MKRPKISICIPTYNHKKYIQDCIMSVISQDVPADMEILVGNDYSSDESTGIIEDLASRYNGIIRHVQRKENIGPFENLKLLVLEAQGDFIAHLDGDDYWQPGKLQTQLNFLINSPECVACYTNAWVVDDNLLPLGIFNNNLPIKFDLKYLLKKGNFLNHSSILYRSEYRNCVLDSPKSFIDYRTHIGLAMHGLLGYINAPYVTYRHASSQSMIRLSTERVRLMYFEALLYAFDQNKLDDIYEVAWEDFVARLVKEGMSKLDMPFLSHWFLLLWRNIKKSRAKIFFIGFAGGLLKVFSASLRRIFSFLGLTGRLRVVNER